MNFTIESLKKCKTIKDWNSVCDAVKAVNNGKYPEWWYDEVVTTGLAKEMGLYFEYGDAFKPTWMEEFERGIEIVSGGEAGSLLLAAVEAAAAGETIILNDDFSYPIQNNRLSRRNMVKMSLAVAASDYLPSSFAAHYKNPLTGRVFGEVDRTVSQEQQAIKIAKAEAKRLRKQKVK
jgi:hypothetical protein